MKLKPLIRKLIWLAVLLIALLRFMHLDADFPNHTPWMVDQAKFTDEGWWANAAVRLHLAGHWNLPGDYNPAAALPVWPAMLALVFHWTGVSAVAARALSVLLSLGTIANVCLLLGSFSESRSPSQSPSVLAAVLLATSPFAYVFSRLAILDTCVVFELSLLLLVSSTVIRKRPQMLVLLAALCTVTVLTKTTAVLLLPGIAWLAQQSLRTRLSKTSSFLLALLTVFLLPGVLFELHKALVAGLGFAEDYQYFFLLNSWPGIDWSATPAILALTLRNCLWIDRVVYPFALLALFASIVRFRGLWKDPLYTASWILIAAQLAFIFTRQDDQAPRYFLGMLLPLVLVVVLSLEQMRLRSRIAYRSAAAVLLVAAAANGYTVLRFVLHPSYQFQAAATSIAAIIRTSSDRTPLMLGISADQVALMTGIPSINDAYGTQDLGPKLLRYKPTWYLAWNGIGDDIQPALAPFELEKIASYPVFDDDERNQLILYRMKPRNETPAPKPELPQH